VHALTRTCLEILLSAGWPVTIQTRSSLVVRDMDLLAEFDQIEVGLTITTDKDEIRKIFEPNSSRIPARIRALEKLKARGISTYAFVGPILPMDPEALAQRLEPVADEVLIDRMNYPRSIMPLLKRHGFEFILQHEFHMHVEKVFKDIFGPGKVSTCY
jgi:DNA repair photolyase